MTAVPPPQPFTVGVSGAAVERYNSVARLLHWTIAALIIVNIALAWAAEWEWLDGRTAFFWHKSFGITVLGLSVLRLAWRLTHRVPPLPLTMPAWEKFAARATHWAFYGIMLGLPLTGWAFSTGGGRPTPWFGLTVPWFPGITPGDRAAAAAPHDAHVILGWMALFLVLLHVAAALKHRFLNRDGVFAHMWPGAGGQERAVAADTPTLH